MRHHAEVLAEWAEAKCHYLNMPLDFNQKKTLAERTEWVAEAEKRKQALLEIESELYIIAVTNLEVLRAAARSQDAGRETQG